MAFIPAELRSRSSLLQPRVSPQDEAAPPRSSATDGSCFVDRDTDSHRCAAPARALPRKGPRERQTLVSSFFENEQTSQTLLDHREANDLEHVTSVLPHGNVCVQS